jgi:hypothetical protein
VSTRKSTAKKIVHVVIAYKFSGVMRGSTVFFEVFGSSFSASQYVHELEMDGFKAEVQRKEVRK